MASEKRKKTAGNAESALTLWTQSLFDQAVAGQQALAQQLAAAEARLTALESATRGPPWWQSWVDPAKPHAWKLAVTALGMVSLRLTTGQWPSVPDFMAFLRLLITGG